MFAQLSNIFAILFQVIGLGFTSALGEYGIIEFDIDTYLEIEDVMRDYLAADTIIQYFDLIGIFVLLWILMKFVNKEPFINLGFSIKGKMGVSKDAPIFLLFYHQEFSDKCPR